MTLKIREYDSISNEAVVELMTHINVERVTRPYNIIDNKTPVMRTKSVSIIAFANSEVLPLHSKIKSVHAFLTTNIVLEKHLQVPQKTEDGYFSYHLFAKVRDWAKQCVCIGEIDIILDIPLPKDIVNDSYISFDVVRLDIVTGVPG